MSNPFYPYAPRSMRAFQPMAMIRYPRYRAMVWNDGGWVALGTPGGNFNGWNEERPLRTAIRNLAKMYKPKGIWTWRSDYGPWMVVNKDASPGPLPTAPLSSGKGYVPGAPRRASYWARSSW